MELISKTLHLLVFSVWFKSKKLELFDLSIVSGY